MPEIYFNVRWPDGATERCYSPSLIVTDYFTAGEAYPLPDFAARSREALTIASERVRARYGMGCTHAQAQLARIERNCAQYTPASPSTVPTVVVEGFQPCP